MTLAEFILSKLTRGYPHKPLLNCYKTYCQVPTKKQLHRWITEYNK